MFATLFCTEQWFSHCSILLSSKNRIQNPGRLSHAAIVTPRNQQTFISCIPEDLKFVLLLLPFTPTISLTPEPLLSHNASQSKGHKSAATFGTFLAICPVGKPIGFEEHSLNATKRHIYLGEFEYFIILQYLGRGFLGGIPLLKYLRDDIMGWMSP